MNKSLCDYDRAPYRAIIVTALLAIGIAGCSTDHRASGRDDLKVAETLIEKAELNTDTDAARQQFTESLSLLTATIGANELASKELSIAYGLRGRVNHNMRALDKAKADLDESLRLDSGNTSSRFNRAVILGLIGDLENATADLTRIIDSGEAVPEAHGLRGSIFYRQRRFEEAEADLTIAIDHDPSSATNIELRGDTFRELNQFDAAIKDYEKAILLINELWDSLGFTDREGGDTYDEERMLLKIGATLVDANRREEAIQTYKDVLRLNPNNAEAAERIEYLSQP